MSWSLSGQDLPREDAKHLIRKLFEAQPAYHNDAFNQAKMDEGARYAGKVADSAPQGAVIGISAYGHSNGDGTGNIGVSISISRPAPVALEPEEVVAQVPEKLAEAPIKPGHEPKPEDEGGPALPPGVEAGSGSDEPVKIEG